MKNYLLLLKQQLFKNKNVYVQKEELKENKNAKQNANVTDENKKIKDIAKVLELEFAVHNLKKIKKEGVNAYNMDVNNLYVAECFVCPGPIMKRIRPRAQGRAFRIRKRTSHITVVVAEKE